MLSIYRRHTRACSARRPQHDRQFWRCTCTIHVEGAIGGRYIRQSLKTRVREQANRRIMEAEARGSWEALASSAAKRKTLVEAIGAYFTDAASVKGRELAAPTLGKYRTLLGRLKQFCQERSLVELSDLTTEVLRSFRETWPTGPRATGNNICRLRSFFRFCIENEWLSKNPAIALRGPKHVKDAQKLPFTAGQMAAILAVAESVSVQAGNSDLVALILLMRHSGLRISDAVLLTSDRITADGQLQLYTQKTGSWVSMPLPPFLIEQLAAVEVKQGSYLFVSGSTKLETATDLWRRKLNRAFELAGVSDATPHRFRHTFAVDLLSKGVDIKSVSLLLGHSSVTITEKFYAAWITARQQALSEQFRRTWGDTGIAA